jgi:hypothetical protein
LTEHRFGDADTSRFRERFDSSRKIHRISEDVVRPLFDVPEMNPDAQLDGRAPGLRIAFLEMLMDVDGALDRAQSAVELDQEPVSRRLDLASLVSLEKGTNEPLLLPQ